MARQMGDTGDGAILKIKTRGTQSTCPNCRKSTVWMHPAKVVQQDFFVSNGEKQALSGLSFLMPKKTYSANSY